MSLASTTVFECRVTGSDSSAGGYNPSRSGSSTDRSQSDTAYKSGTNLTVDATTNTDVAPDGYTPDATADPGNLIQITAGGSFTLGWYEIISVVSGKWRLDRSPAATTSSGGTWAMGGALASPGQAGNAASVTGQTVYIKNGTYTITSASSNVAGGCVNVNNFTRNVLFIGYGTTRTVTNTDTKPILRLNAGLSSATFTQSDCLFINLEFDGNSQTTSRFMNSSGRAWRCLVRNCTAAGSGNLFVACVGTGNSAVVFNAPSGLAVACELYANTATPFTSGQAVQCLSYSNTGGSTDGFGGGYLTNCVAYGNGRDGFRSANGLVNCVAEANAGWGFNLTAVIGSLLNCAGYNNTSGLVVTGSVTPQANLITVTAGSVFTNAAGGDFSLNTTVNRGALLRAAGYPGTFPAGTTVGHVDIGAAQHADPAILIQAPIFTSPIVEALEVPA